jgi:dTDP-4-dehydrorhamnose 3,5-epimerase
MGQIQVAYDLDGIAGLCVIEPAVHGDSRGYFMETFSQKDMYEAGLYYAFVQDNQSMSVKGVLRGLHFQKRFPQTKLVRVIRGAVYDVAVDLRGLAHIRKISRGNPYGGKQKAVFDPPRVCARVSGAFG